MKLVINKCYGGFNLSWAAIKRHAELKGRSVQRFAWELKGDDFVERPMADDEPEVIFETYRLSGMSDTEHFSPRGIARDDPDLVRVVEELGEAADSRLSALKVVEIPDGVEWDVEEYDGMEHIAERHRTWG